MKGPSGPVGPTGYTGQTGATGGNGLKTCYFSILNFSGDFCRLGIHDLPHINVVFSNPSEQEVVTNISVETTPTKITFKAITVPPQNTVLESVAVAFQDSNKLAWVGRADVTPTNPHGFVEIKATDATGCPTAPKCPTCLAYLILKWKFVPPA